MMITVLECPKMGFCKQIFTCQVFILIPFVVPVSFALFTMTLETSASELPAPKLPMLQNNIIIKTGNKLFNKNHQHDIRASC